MEEGPGLLEEYLESGPCKLDGCKNAAIRVGV